MSKLIPWGMISTVVFKRWYTCVISRDCVGTNLVGTDGPPALKVTFVRTD